MSHTYEIEVKTLLGSKESAEDLKNKLKKQFSNFILLGSHPQLSHYFNTPKDLSQLHKTISTHISSDKQKSFDKIILEGKNVSIRTRDADGKIIFIVKASIDEGTSHNTVSRIEFESEMNFKNIDDLDKLLLDEGLSYQAKWSREREEYKIDEINICIDKNAGYGYIAEFEKITEDKNLTESIRGDILSLMKKLGVKELPQDRLERMFSHYNKHWKEYYGTDKIFLIE